MRIFSITLLATTPFSFTVAAAPSLQVVFDLVERSPAGDKTLMHPMFITPSGHEAIIQSGRFEYKITPILLEDGRVDVSATLNELDGEKARQIVDQRVKAKLSHATEVQVDNLVFRTTTTLLK